MTSSARPAKNGKTKAAAPDRAKRRLPDFHTAPGHLFRRARQFHDALWASAVDDNLTPLQYAVLTAVELEPNIDQRTLGERIALDKSTIGDILQRLSKRGLIKRGKDANDGRRWLLSVTDEGRVALYRVAPIVSEIGEQMLAPLTAKERAELMRLMDKVVYSPDALALSPAGDSPSRSA